MHDLKEVCTTARIVGGAMELVGGVHIIERARIVEGVHKLYELWAVLWVLWEVYTL